MQNTKSKLLIFEGVLIILLVLFSGFLAWQNQKLTEELQKLTRQTPTPTQTVAPSPSPSVSPTATSSATPKATAAPLNIFAP